ncbi:MAG: hypothetical protein CME71_04330 [Halobacteriovorax sp.]|nr:hypothetical protein [Halobacteriovorax sp.]
MTTKLFILVSLALSTAIHASDEVTTSSSAIERVNTYQINANKDSRPIYAKIAIQNTNLHSSNDQSEGDIQSVELGIGKKITSAFSAALDLSKDIIEEKANFSSSKLDWSLGGSFDAYQIDKFSVDVSLTYAVRNLNFEGLALDRVGHVTQKNLFAGARLSYQLNDQYSFSAGLDYSVSNRTRNDKAFGVRLDSSGDTIVELSASKTYEQDKQIFASVARESIAWESGEKKVKYASNLIKLGMLFTF